MSKDIVKAAYDGKVVKDSLGREITLRKPTFINRYNLYKILKEDADIPACVNMMSAILYVAKIDDYVFDTPTSKIHAEASLQKLDEAGMEAVFSEIINELQEEKESVKK